MGRGESTDRNAIGCAQQWRAVSPRPVSARRRGGAWHETIRAVEEFINLPIVGIADDRLRDWLCAIQLDGAFVENPGPTWLVVREALTPLFEPEVVARFTRVMLYAGAMGVAFAAHGQGTHSAGITLNTIGGAIDYFQSRRRHFVSLLYTMPYACSVSLVLQPYDALTVLMPRVAEPTAGLHDSGTA